jgi:hypothetical protein
MNRSSRHTRLSPKPVFSVPRSPTVNVTCAACLLLRHALRPHLLRLSHPSPSDQTSAARRIPGPGGVEPRIKRHNLRKILISQWANPLAQPAIIATLGSDD